MRYTITVNIDVNAINCHRHGHANFRPRVDRVFMTRPGRLTHRDADVPVHVFLTLIFENCHAPVRLHASCARAVTGMWYYCKIGHGDRRRVRNTSTSTLTVLLNLSNFFNRNKSQRFSRQTRILAVRLLVISVTKGD